MAKTRFNAKLTSVVLSTVIAGCLLFTSHVTTTPSAPKLLFADGIFAAAVPLASGVNFIRGGSARNDQWSAAKNRVWFDGISRRLQDGNDDDDDDDGVNLGENSEISSKLQHPMENENVRDAVNPMEINEAQVNTDNWTNGEADDVVIATSQERGGSGGNEAMGSISQPDLDAAQSWSDDDDDDHDHDHDNRGADVSVQSETIQMATNPDEKGTAPVSQESLVQNDNDGTLTGNESSLKNENSPSMQSGNEVENANNSQAWPADDDDEDNVSKGMTGSVNADIPGESIATHPQGEALKSMADVVNNEESSSEPGDDDDDDDNVGTADDAESPGGLAGGGMEAQNEETIPAQSSEGEIPSEEGSVMSTNSNLSNPSENTDNTNNFSKPSGFESEGQSQPVTSAAAMEVTDVMKVEKTTDLENLGTEGQNQLQSSVEMEQGNGESGNTNLPPPSYDDDDDDDDDDDNFSTFVEGGDSGSQPQSDYSFVQDSIDESTGLPHNEVGSPSSSMSENYDGDGSSLLDEDDSHVSYHREENETSPLSPEAAVPRSAGNAVSENESGNLGTNEVNEGNEVASQENEAIGIGNEENEVPSQQNEEAGVGIGNIEEAGQVVEGASMGEVQITGNNNENDSENVVASEGNVNSEGGGGNDEITNQSIAPLSICDQATSCMDCLNLAIEQLQQGMNYEPCYWVGMDGQQKCAAPSQFIDATNNHQEGAYQCAEGNSAVFTGEGWDVALAAIAAASQVPAEGGGNEENVPYPQQNEQSSGSDNYGDGYYWDDGDDDSFFDMVKSTLNVLALAAFFAGLLVCRSRIRERQRVNPSTGVIGAIKDEIFSLIVAAVSRAASAARDEGHSGSARASDFTVTSSLHSSLSRPEANNFGQETVPLSTATDEEWGWDDDEISTPNLELSGIRTDEAKEEDDLALAIAMSLSESDNAATAPSNGGMKTNLPTKSTVNTVRTAPKSVDKKLQIPKPTTSSRLPAVPMKSQLENQNANVSKPETPPSSGQSIEDLLGQMGGNGGPVITKFGQRPPMEHANAKPLAPKKVETEEDDIFASMGLSNFPTKPAGGVMSTPKPAPSTGGWQASTAFASASAAAAPKSAPLPSLLAATADDLDDADADWGDDGDLDDLLDD